MTPTPAEARQSLAAHAAARGADLRARYGDEAGVASALERILADRDFARYPCQLRFGSAALLPGEPAFAEPQGQAPEDGFILWIHERFASDPAAAAAFALYQLAAVNYGAFAGPEDAEAFGAAALGLSPDSYYERLCALAGDGPDNPCAEAGKECGEGCPDCCDH